ncbi:MAG: menG [Chlamydiales bacterium]|jgi:demethylmenaquinone methyltransferase/2-methoxy-6-polyprenyl-1,4-benzoquinol methylase|nr:menG [Chlamydiales bacterium]
MFSRIAKSYDRTNDVLSFSLHRRWSQKLIQALQRRTSIAHFLDLCAGTGQISQAFLKSDHTLKEMHLLDFCPEMLAVARFKLSAENTCALNFIESDASQIPLKDSSLDAVAIAYGIRNVKSPKEVCLEVHRVLKKGGAFALLELTRPTWFPLNALHRLYLKKILPYFGKWLTSNPAAYRYLSESIDTFMAPDEMAKTLQESGFEAIEKIPLLGGVATLILASKGVL